MKILLCFLIFIASPFTFGKVHVINMLNKEGRQTMTFSPSFLKVEVGHSVTFIPESKGHNLRFLSTPSGVTLPKGKTNEKVTVKMEKEGLYVYECGNHSVMGMAGVIQVGNAINYEETKAFIQKHKRKVAMNKERLENQLKKVSL